MVLMTALMVTGLAVFINSTNNKALQSRQKMNHSEAFLRMQSLATSGTRNPQLLLNQLRSSPSTGNVFAACVPDAATSTSYSCPSINSGLKSQVSYFNSPAFSDYSGAGTALVDIVGTQVSGTPAAPVFLSRDGDLCLSASSNCPLKSVGYFLRENPSRTQNPGQIKVVYSLSRNPAYTGELPPMKTHFFEVHLGRDWENSGGYGSTCPPNTVRAGYLSNGKVNCVNPEQSCPQGQISVGSKEDGSANCIGLNACDGSKELVLSPNGDGFECREKSPCPEGSAFLGYQGGNGSPICQNPTATCPAGQIQLGLSTNSNGILEASCTAVPTCRADQKLVMNNNRLRCEADSLKSCDPGQIAVRTLASGDLECKEPPGRRQVCDDDEIPYGFDQNHTLLCKKYSPKLPKACRAQVISKTPCSKVSGLVANGFSPGGNPKYVLPKAVSGATFDYEVVQIGDQCWFSENSREPNKHGLAAYHTGNSGTHGPISSGGPGEFADGVGKHYTLSAAFGGKPLADRPQGVCPAGWHVPSDCEFMLLESELGLPPEALIKRERSVAEHNILVNQWKPGGDSGFNFMPHGHWDMGSGGGMNYYGSFGMLRISSPIRADGTIVKSHAGYRVTPYWGSSRWGYTIGFSEALGENVRCLKD